MKNKIKIKNVQGFSLIELVFAMAFLTLIILGVANLQTSNLAMMNSQNNQIQANFLATQGASLTKGIGFTKIDDLYRDDGGCDPILPATTICRFKLNPILESYTVNLLLADTTEYETIPNSPFERVIEIDPIDPIVPTNAYQVTAFVEWDDATGSHRRKIGNETVNAHAEAKIIVSE